LISLEFFYSFYVVNAIWEVDGAADSLTKSWHNTNRTRKEKKTMEEEPCWVGRDWHK
jgi:hypothetical protein